MAKRIDPNGFSGLALVRSGARQDPRRPGAHIMKSRMANMIFGGILALRAKSVEKYHTSA